MSRSANSLVSWLFIVKASLPATPLPPHDKPYQLWPPNADGQPRGPQARVGWSGLLEGASLGHLPGGHSGDEGRERIRHLPGFVTTDQKHGVVSTSSRNQTNRIRVAPDQV